MHTLRSWMRRLAVERRPADGREDEDKEEEEDEGREDAREVSCRRW